MCGYKDIARFMVVLFLGVFCSKDAFAQTVYPIADNDFQNCAVGQLNAPGGAVPGCAWKTYFDPSVVGATAEILPSYNGSGAKVAHLKLDKDSPLAFPLAFSYGVAPVDPENLPDQLSISYIATAENACAVQVRFGGVSGFDRWMDPFTKNSSWQSIPFEIDTPPSATSIGIYVAEYAKGDCYFHGLDVRRVADADNGAPANIIFVMEPVDIENANTKTTVVSQFKDAIDGDTTSPFTQVQYVSWDNLSSEILKRAKVVVMVRPPARPIVPYGKTLPYDDGARVKMLTQYVQQGGALLLGEQEGQQLTGMTIPFNLAEQFGLQILLDNISSDTFKTTFAGAQANDTYSWTKNISSSAPAAITKNVTDILYPSFVDMNTYAGVLPFKGTSDWKTILTAGGTSSSLANNLGFENYDNGRHGPYSVSVPIAGYRTYGLGRVAYVGFNPGNIFTHSIVGGTNAAIVDAVMNKGVSDSGHAYPSNVKQFYLNIFNWLAQAAPKNVMNLSMTQTSDTVSPNVFNGIIGARTSYSSGSSTVDDYVSAARAANFKFIVFLEDFENLKAGGFESLKEDCDNINSKYADFLAVPGITYRNTDGNYQYAFGDSLVLPSVGAFVNGAKRFYVHVNNDNNASLVDERWLYSMLGFDNSSGWYYFKQPSTPYRPLDNRLVNSMAVVTQEDQKTKEGVKDTLDIYGLQARNGQALWPIALTLMKSKSEVSLAQNGTYFYNSVYANNIKQLNDYFSTYDGRNAWDHSPALPMNFGQIFMTNGPQINSFGLQRSDISDSDLYSTARSSWQIKNLNVHSNVGLKEVSIMDGDVVLRRFLSNGKKDFAYSGSIPQEKQRYIWIHAIDTKGGEAISRDVQSDNRLLKEFQGGDRQNQYFYSAQRSSTGSTVVMSYGTNAAIPDKGPWNGIVKPVGALIFDANYGEGKSFDSSNEDLPSAEFHPYLIYNGIEPDYKKFKDSWVLPVVAKLDSVVEGALHVQPQRVMASPDVLVADRISDGVFGTAAQPVIHVWNTLFPVKDAKYLQTTAHVYNFLSKVDNPDHSIAVAYLWDQDFETLADLPVDESKIPYSIFVAQLNRSTFLKEEDLYNGGKFTVMIPDKSPDVTLRKGDFIGYLGNRFGSLLVFNMTDGLILHNDVALGISLASGGSRKVTVPAHSKYNVKVLVVGLDKFVTPAAAKSIAVKMVKDYGLNGQPPTYKASIKHGTIISQQYIMATKGDCGYAKVAVSGIGSLEGNLGAKVSELNNNWSAMLQVQGSLRKNRLVPVGNNSAYAVIRSDEDNGTIFIGHPVIADNKDLILNVTQDGGKWVLEVHNPTGKDIAATVMSSPGISGFKYKQSVSVPAGSSLPALAIPVGEPDNSADAETCPIDWDAMIAAPSATNNPPTKPELVTPEDGTAGLDASVNFGWSKSSEPDGDDIVYHLYVCEDSEFTGCEQIDVSLNELNKHTSDLAILFLGVPFAGMLTRKRRMLVLVIAALLASSAFNACREADNGAVRSFPKKVVADFSTTVTGLKPGTTYYWKVVADDGKTGTAESDVWSFTTK